MKFLIKKGKPISNKKLVYFADECSFNMGTVNYNVSIEWILNKISLSSHENIIVDVSGFCGLASHMNKDIYIPKYSKGILKVEHNLEYGFAYSIFDKGQPVSFNSKTGWVCVGNPIKLSNAVEFIKNCIAVINDNGDFLSLWLKPVSLPKFDSVPTSDKQKDI